MLRDSTVDLVTRYELTYANFPGTVQESTLCLWHNFEGSGEFWLVEGIHSIDKASHHPLQSVTREEAIWILTQKPFIKDKFGDCRKELGLEQN